MSATISAARLPSIPHCLCCLRCLPGTWHFGGPGGPFLVHESRIVNLPGLRKSNLFPTVGVPRSSLTANGWCGAPLHTFQGLCMYLLSATGRVRLRGRFGEGTPGKLDCTVVQHLKAEPLGLKQLWHPFVGCLAAFPEKHDGHRQLTSQLALALKGSQDSHGTSGHPAKAELEGKPQATRASGLRQTI